MPATTTYDQSVLDQATLVPEVYGEVDFSIVPERLDHDATLDDVQQFFADWYRPSNARLVLCGPVEPAEAFDLAQKYLGAVPALERPRHLAAATPSLPARQSVTRGAVPHPLVYLSWATPPAAHEDHLSGCQCCWHVLSLIRAMASTSLRCCSGVRTANRSQVGPSPGKLSPRRTANPSSASGSRRDAVLMGEVSTRTKGAVPGTGRSPMWCS